ncbi:ATM interactor-like isoform X2 [Ylistrum balloti]|uniref:ATM interactor-like isoform X2 n=1 Tax=Ylistrum balloti TaxID=509963 RepID=UPI0029059DDC|nr:ATM interactor-like isoform X2 [Ylistrum balloti]
MGLSISSSANRNNKDKNGDFPTEYHCPKTSCPYNISSPRHFASMKLLKQHFNKVHGEKKYKCGKCGAAFSLSRDKDRHEVRCGVVYKCATCQCPYTTREAMLTHCQRKSHDIPAEIIKAREELAAKKMKKSKKRQFENQLPGQDPFQGQPPPKVILVNIQPTPPSLQTNPGSLGTKVTHLKPILCKPTPNLNVIPLTTVTVTVDNIKVKQKKVEDKQNADNQKNLHERGDNHGKMPRNESHVSGENQLANTQTQALLMETGMQTNVTIPQRKTTDQQRNAAQTQTSGDLILQTAMATANIPIHKLSVGTQMTPRSKVRALEKGRTCSSETQTVNEQTAVRKRRRRKGSLIGEPLRMDSTSQTSAAHPLALITMTSDSTCQVESVGMMSTCAQTNRMVDNICQTLAMPLQDVINPDDVFLYSSSAAHKVTMGPSNSPPKDMNTFISPTSNAPVNADNGMEDSMRIRVPQTYSRRSRATGKRRKAVADCSPSLVPNQHSGNMAVETSRSPVSNIGSRVSLNKRSNNTQGTSTDLDLGDDFQNFLISTCRDISVGTDVEDIQSSARDIVYTKRMPSSSFSNLVEASTQVMDSINTSSSASSQFGITQTSVFGGQTSKGQDAGSMTSDSQQTISEFVSLTDSQVQTLTSASDLDSLLLRTAQTNTNASDTLMDMHTQTINDFDMFDLLMNNMETQTTDDLDLDNFTFTDIQTQTMFDFQSVDDPLSTMVGEDTQSSATQTTSVQRSGMSTDALHQSEATQTPQLGSTCLTDTETQTTLPGLFSSTDTHTQTTLDDLANIFAQFD